MPSTERKQRYIDKRLTNSGGGTTLGGGGGGAPAGPAIPTPPAPGNLRVTSTKIQFSAVSPMASASLAWNAPSTAIPQRYVIQWSTNSGFTAPTTRQAAASPTTAEIDALPAGVAVYFRVAAVVSDVQGAWSNTASALMPSDVAAPAAPTTLNTSWSGLTGDLTIQWTNPTSTNFRDVRVRIYASNGGTLLREAYAASGQYVWSKGQHYADTSGVFDPSVYLVLTARSWGGVFSATDLTGTATLAAPSTPTGLTSTWAADSGTAGAGCLVTWTQSAAVASYRLTIDGVARDVGYTGRYDYPFTLNQAEHAGTADPVLSLSLVAVDALGQASTAATTTATNAAPPATTITVFAGFSSVGLTIGASTALDLKDYRVRVYKAGVLTRTVFFTDLRPTYAVEDGDGSYTFDVAARDAFNQVGTASAQTSPAVVTDLAGFVDELRSGAVYSDSLTTTPETLYDAYTDDNRASGGVSYTSNAGWVRWIRFERNERDRYRTITLAMAALSGTSSWYIRTSEDASTWAYFAGPVTSSRILTSVASAAAAQAAAVSAATLGGSATSRVDLPSIVSARYVEVWLRNTTGTTRVDEFYPRRLVQSDDLEAESIKAVNIAAGAITADKLTATAIDGFTITGATIIAGGGNVQLDSAGIAIVAGVETFTPTNSKAISFVNTLGSTVVSQIFAVYDPDVSKNEIRLNAIGTSSYQGGIVMRAVNGPSASVSPNAAGVFTLGGAASSITTDLIIGGSTTPASRLHVVGSQLRLDPSTTSTARGILMQFVSGFPEIRAGQVGNYGVAEPLLLQSHGGLLSVGGAVLLNSITAPSTPATAGQGVLYIDAADNDLKIKFANGVVRTIALN